MRKILIFLGISILGIHTSYGNLETIRNELQNSGRAGIQVIDNILTNMDTTNLKKLNQALQVRDDYSLELKYMKYKSADLLKNTKTTTTTTNTNLDTLNISKNGDMSWVMKEYGFSYNSNLKKWYSLDDSAKSKSSNNRYFTDEEFYSFVKEKKDAGYYFDYKNLKWTKNNDTATTSNNTNTVSNNTSTTTNNNTEKVEENNKKGKNNSYYEYLKLYYDYILEIIPSNSVEVSYRYGFTLDSDVVRYYFPTGIEAGTLPEGPKVVNKGKIWTGQFDNKKYTTEEVRKFVLEKIKNGYSYDYRNKKWIDASEGDSFAFSGSSNSFGKTLLQHLESSGVKGIDYAIALTGIKYVDHEYLRDKYGFYVVDTPSSVSMKEFGYASYDVSVRDPNNLGYFIEREVYDFLVDKFIKGYIYDSQNKKWIAPEKINTWPSGKKYGYQTHGINNKIIFRELQENEVMVGRHIRYSFFESNLLVNLYNYNSLEKRLCFKDVNIKTTTGSNCFDYDDYIDLFKVCIYNTNTGIISYQPPYTYIPYLPECRGFSNNSKSSAIPTTCSVYSGGVPGLLSYKYNRCDYNYTLTLIPTYEQTRKYYPRECGELPEKDKVSGYTYNHTLNRFTCRKITGGEILIDRQIVSEKVKNYIFSKGFNHDELRQKFVSKNENDKTGSSKTSRYFNLQQVYYFIEDKEKNGFVWNDSLNSCVKK